MDTDTGLVACEGCGAGMDDSQVLGALGHLLWFRCRCCGFETSVDVSEV